MRKVLLVLSFTLFGLGAAQLHAQSSICNTTTMYGLTGGGLVYPITLSNATVGAAITTSAYTGTSGANALGYNPANGKLYFWASTYSARTQTKDSCVGQGKDRICYPVTTTTVSSDSLFVSYNPSTNTYTKLSAANSAGYTTIRTGCVSADGTGYYCLNNDGQLWYYNIAGNYWTSISSTWKDELGADLTSTVALQTSGDMAIDGFGNLWMLIAGASTYGIYKVSAPLPTTSVASITMTKYVKWDTPNPDTKTIAGIGFSSLGEIYISSLSDSLYVMNSSLQATYVNKFSLTNVGNDLSSCQFPLNVLQPVGVLPVKFLDFQGELLQDNTVQLSWQAQIDEKHQYFEVERSVDGVHFASLGKRSSVSAYRDVAPNSGTNIYRIKQVDKEGRTTYSKSINVNLELDIETRIYPNPAADVVNIKLRAASPESIAVKITDLQGRVVYRQNGLAGHDLKVDVSNWKPQFYVVTIYNSRNEVISTQKVVKY